MMEVHGWISISLSTDGEGEDAIDAAILPLIAIVERIHSEQNLVTIRPINGRYFITIVNHPNHKGEEFEDIMRLLDFTCKYFKGAYGLIYVKNDEATRDNEFVVYKLARGQVSIEKDYYLSPCNPLIED